MKSDMWIRKYSILRKILFPIMIIVFIQTVIYTEILLNGGIMNSLVDNSYDILNERVLNRSMYLESEMIKSWSNLYDSHEEIINNIKALLDTEGKLISDIKSDINLNKKLIEVNYKNVIYMLRKTGATGAYLILDGKAHEKDTSGNTKVGFYVRDHDPSTYETSNNDLLLERGFSTIAKQTQIPLDSYWEAFFLFEKEGDREQDNFYYKPLQQAKNDVRAQGRKLDSMDYGYWSKVFSMNVNDMDIITYSIPLITKNNEVLGVLGVEITINHLFSFLTYNEILGKDSEASTSYILGIMENDEQLEVVAQNGPLYSFYYGRDKFLKTKISGRENIYDIQNEQDESQKILGDIQELKLYNTNTPFSNQKWVLAALLRKDDLLKFPNKVRALAYVLSVIFLILGIVGVSVASHVITNPIIKLVRKIRTGGVQAQMNLDKIGIDEIDELTNEIIKLSNKAVESAQKISKIMKMTELPIGVFEYSYHSNEVFCSSNLYKILGWDLERQDDGYMEKSLFETRLYELLDDKTEEKMVFLIYDENGNERWIHMDCLDDGVQLLAAVSDITEEMLEKRKIMYERDYDILTNLYNRRAFHDKLDHLFTEKKSQLKFAVMIMWDIDNLKYVNDMYGHEAGDSYICGLADCLKLFQDYNALVARRSGDEFFTFIYGYETKEEIRDIIDKIWAEIGHSSILLLKSTSVKIRVSAGITWYPDDSISYEELVRYADFAMYEAKHNKKGCICEFNKSAYSDNAILINGQGALDKLLENRLVQFAMQPIVDVSTAKVYGYEMLMRSLIPDLSSPLEIIRIAKSQAKLYVLERLTMFMAMEQFVGFVKDGRIGRDKKVFINSIANNILTTEEEESFYEMFKDYTNQIVIELTEEEPVVSDYLSRKLEAIKRWSAMLAIDDFGSGYNNEATLLKVSPNIIKVDMAIVRDIDTDSKRQSVFEGIVKLSRQNHIKVVAEGIETKEEMIKVIEMGADYLQGYYIGYPGKGVGIIKQSIIKEIELAYAYREKRADE